MKQNNLDTSNIRGDCFISVSFLLHQNGAIVEQVAVANLLSNKMVEEELRGGAMLKETTNTNEFENTIDAVNNLTEEDAKSLLRLIYGFVNTAMTGNGGDKVKLEVVHKVSDIYKRIPDLNELRNK